MNPRCTPVIRVLLAVAVLAAPATLLADIDADLHKAYYTENATKDYAAAKKLYDKVAAGAKGAARRDAIAGAARCRDHLVAEDFANIMPDDAMVYVELRRPGEIIGKLAEMLGLTGKSVQEVLAQRPNAGSSVPWHIPKEIVISPALFEFFESFGGAAVAITKINPNGPPEGVMAIHHGDTDLFKGLLETAFQFSPTAEKIRDLPTFGTEIAGVTVTGVLTESLFIAGTGRDLVDGVAARLLGSGTSSLGSRDDLKELAERRAGSTLFAYVNLQKVIELAKTEAGPGDRELKIADVLVDLDSLRWATFSFGIDDGTLGVEMALRLSDDHRNLVYNIFRLPPMSRKCLQKIPENAAAFFGLGLNPAWAGVVADTGAPYSVTGLDVFREFFGNIRELSAFVVPGKPGGSGEIPLPNVGIVMSVNDPARSKALWSQMLSLPGLAAGAEPVPPKQIQIAGTSATAFACPKIGAVYMAELDDCVVIGLTRNALKAAVRAATGGKSVLDNPVMANAIADLPRDTSIMVVAHVGRLAALGGSMAGALGAGGEEAILIQMATSAAADLCKEMVFWAGIGQAPNQLTFRAALRGLPNLNVALKRFGPMLKLFSGLAAPATAGRTVRIEAAEAPAAVEFSELPPPEESGAGTRGG